MKLRSAAIMLLCVTASPLPAQDRDAQILGPGQLRLFAGGEFGHFSAVFADGGTLPFDGGLGGPLTPTSLSALAPFAGKLDGFFTATEGHSGGGATDTGQLTAGTLAAELGWGTRSFPFGVSLGIIPRVELGARIPIFRNERFTRRFDLSGGNLGINPDVAGNEALMSTISPEWGEIGGSAVLPLSGSPLALELQHRVVELTGEELVLPDAALDAEQLESTFEIGPVPRLLSAWGLGDLELEAKVAVLRSFDGLHPPAGSGIQYRVSTNAALVLPTGRRDEVNPLIERGPEVGFGGVRGGIAADLFLGERGWISAGGTFARFGSGDVLVALVPPGGPFAPEVEIVEAEFDRGDETDFWLTPRVFLTREVSFGLGLRSERWGEGTQRLASGAIPIPARSRQSFGFSLRYSTLPHLEAGGGIEPLEVAVGYRGAFRGSDGLPALRAAFIQVSLVPRFWGGNGR